MLQGEPVASAAIAALLTKDTQSRRQDAPDRRAKDTRATRP